LDEMSGERPVSGAAAAGKPKSYKCTGQGVTWPPPKDDGVARYLPNDKGGASRFYYCAKASRRERSQGLEGMVRARKDLTVEERQWLYAELERRGVSVSL